MTDPVINVVYATDRRGVLGCAVSGWSVLRHLPAGRPVAFWILEDRVDSAGREKLAHTLRASPHRATVSFVPLNAAWFSGLLRSKAVPPTTYARLLLGDLLPLAVDRCVWLDIDTVCSTGLDALYDLPLGDSVVGCALNGAAEGHEREFLRLGITGGSRYFNAGVMLCDLGRWRTERVGQRALEFARGAGERLHMHDQDALNAVLLGRWTELPERWNRWAASGRALSDCVVHYAMAPKPWHADYAGPGADLFYRTVDETAFRGFRPWNPMGLGALLSRGKRKIPYGPTVLRMLRRRLRPAG